MGCGYLVFIDILYSFYSDTVQWELPARPAIYDQIIVLSSLVNCLRQGPMPDASEESDKTNAPSCFHNITCRAETVWMIILQHEAWM